MKRKTTKDILAESFLELAEAKRIDKIRVSDITSNCGMSAPTFYNHFKDKYDLIVWIHTHRVSGIMSKIDKDGYRWRDTLLDGARYYYDNRSYIINALKHTSGQDSFFRYMSTANVDLLCREVARKLGKDDIPEELRVSILVFGYGTAQLICEWLTGLHPYSADQLTALLTGALPEMLTPYLRD